MISFIIIGRNEGWKLENCIRSVMDTIRINSLLDWEVIYVDSDSTDKSIERAKEFLSIKIILLTGLYNAAIARNIGISNSNGENVFCIDGDMEIRPEFLPLVYSKKSGLKFSFVSGQLENYNYDENGNLQNTSWQYNQVIKKDRYFTTTGGIFLIKRILWEEVGGMDNSFKRGQDIELAIRLSKHGYKILRKKEIIAKHHTVSYTHKSRIWKTIFSGDIAYSNSFLLRKHPFSYYALRQITRNYYSLFALMIVIAFSLITGKLYLLTGYLIIVLFRTAKTWKNNILRFFEIFSYYILRDLSFIFFLFKPKRRIKPTQIKYTILNDT